MTFMIWNDDLVTGVELIDRQHRTLVNMVNSLAPLLTRPGAAPPDTVRTLVESLAAYATQHFRDEEALMVSCGLDPRSLAHHRATHARFGQEVGAIAREVLAGAEMSGERLLSFLASWLVLHILGEDQSMARQVRMLAAGASADEAFAQSGGADIHPSPAAVARTLVGVYTVLTRQNRELQTSAVEIANSRDAIRHHNEHLEELVGARTRELEALVLDLARSRDAAEAGNQAKSRFLGAISHELRTPMNAILGFSRLLQGDSVESHRKDRAGKIVSAAEHLLDLIDRIVTYARLEGGQVAPAQERFELKAIAAAALRHARAGAMPAVSVEMNLDPALPIEVRGDERSIARIVGQFADNAAKFTAAGSIRIELQLLGTDPQGRVDVRFAVVDTGIGIAPDQQVRMFDAFVQLDDAPNRQYEGVGIGLALSRQLAQLMDGEIGVESVPGCGSTFWLRLRLEPVATNAATPALVAPPTAAPPPAPLASGTLAAGSQDGTIPAVIVAKLRRIASLLEALDTAAVAVLESAAGQLQPWFGSDIEALQHRIAAFEYEEAATIVRALIVDASRRMEETA